MVLLYAGRSFNGLWTDNNENLFPSGPECSRQHPEELIERWQFWHWMSSFQCLELLTTGQVFKQKATMNTEEPKKCASQGSDGIYHAQVLSHFACGRQCRKLLKSRVD